MREKGVSIDPATFSKDSDAVKPPLSLVPAKHSPEPSCDLYGLWWNELRETIQANFPALILHFEAALSVCGVLGIKKPWRPLTLILEGLPGPGKSLVLNCILGASSEEVQERLYRSDKFSPASFVSQSASIRKAKLRKVDLLPRIKDKILITPELAPTFRGKREVVEERFSILARVLDGRGLVTDSGTHGRRGYQGDYCFCWLGATTPLSAVAFEAMASVGNRIFFFDTSPPRPGLEDLAKLAMKGGSAENERACSIACEDLLDHFFTKHLDDNDDSLGQLSRPSLSPKEATVIASAAWTIARLRAKEQGQEEYEYRIVENLTLLAQGRAAIEGYSEVLPDHLAALSHIVMSSAKQALRPLISGLLQDDTGTLDVGEVEELLGCSRVTALKRMEALAKTRVCRFHPGSAPKTASMIKLAAEAKALTGTA